MKETYDKSVDYIAGETVVGGEYRCANCGETLRIAERKVTNLPVCPNCQSQHWKPGE
jgi:Zn finger protein HypA/HybF involved in hydrogenase expression